MPLRLQTVARSLDWPDFFLANQASAVAAAVAIRTRRQPADAQRLRNATADASRTQSPSGYDNWS
jgi:hypothetical protein